MGEASREGRGLGALAATAGQLAIIVLVWALGFARVTDFGVGLLFDLCCIGWAWLGAALLVRAGVPGLLVTILLAIVLAAMCGLVLAHAWFFDVAIERRLTLVDITGAGLAYFFMVSLPARGLVAFLALFAGLVAGAMLVRPRIPRLPGWPVLAGAGVVLGMLTASVVQAERVASPLFDSAHELYALAARPRVQAEQGAHVTKLAGMLDKHARTRAQGTPHFSKVIVVVMETMTARTFAEQGAVLPDDNFLARERTHFHAFDSYYPNNQDSRTGMLDMLFSRLIPYEAYSDAGYAGYRHLGDAPSLVDTLKGLGYASAFAVSQIELEDVVSELSWDQTLRLDAGEIKRAQEAGRLCFTPDEYEQSCEDLALLPAVIDFVSKHERAFVYQEMIWGHAYEYNAASGLSNTAYYARYLGALQEALRERGLLDETLIALTSDHGFRDKGRQHDPEVYRVPLLLYASRFSAARDARLTSHSDFGMLLFEQLVPDAPRADDNPFVMIVGPTGQGHTFVVDRRGGHLLLWRRLGGERVLAQEGAMSASPAAFLGAFQQYRAAFDQAAGGSAD